MNEQPGKAAGTAEPNVPTSAPLGNFNKPWKIGPRNHALIQDRDGTSLAHVLALVVGTMEPRPPMEIKAIAKHIVACVNFCANIDQELIEALSGGNYELTCKRIGPELAAELANNSRQFHEDQTDRPAAVLTGGAI